MPHKNTLYHTKTIDLIELHFQTAKLAVIFDPMGTQISSIPLLRTRGELKPLSPPSPLCPTDQKKRKNGSNFFRPRTSKPKTRVVYALIPGALLCLNGALELMTRENFERERVNSKTIIKRRSILNIYFTIPAAYLH